MQNIKKYCSGEAQLIDDASECSIKTAHKLHNHTMSGFKSAIKAHTPNFNQISSRSPSPGLGSPRALASRAAMARSSHQKLRKDIDLKPADTRGVTLILHNTSSAAHNLLKNKLTNAKSFGQQHSVLQSNVNDSQIIPSGENLGFSQSIFTHKKTRQYNDYEANKFLGTHARSKSVLDQAFERHMKELSEKQTSEKKDLENYWTMIIQESEFNKKQ